MFVDLPCLCRLLLYVSCLLIYMFNYLIFLSMAHTYAYVLLIYLAIGYLLVVLMCDVMGHAK